MSFGFLFEKKVIKKPNGVLREKYSNSVIVYLKLRNNKEYERRFYAKYL